MYTDLMVRYPTSSDKSTEMVFNPGHFFFFCMLNRCTGYNFHAFSLFIKHVNENMHFMCLTVCVLFDFELVTV